MKSSDTGSSGLPVSLQAPTARADTLGAVPPHGLIANPVRRYSMLHNSASGPEIGLLGWILAGLLPGKHRNRPSEGRPEGRFRCFPGKNPATIRPGRPIYGPEALLRTIEQQHAAPSLGFLPGLRQPHKKNHCAGRPPRVDNPGGRPNPPRDYPIKRLLKRLLKPH